MANEQRIYVGQTALQIQADTKIDLTTLSTGVIKYTDPSGSTGSWPASVVGVATDGIIGTNAAPTLSVGLWTAWAYVTFADSSFAPGDPFTFYVYEEGN